MERDERFSRISSDPKFRRMPQRERKVRIDKRFEAMFKDSRFKVKCNVDKRGRPMALNSRENLRRYYDLSSSAEEASSAESDEDEESDQDEESGAESKDVQEKILETSNNKEQESMSLKSQELGLSKEEPTKLKTLQKTRQSTQMEAKVQKSPEKEDEDESFKVDKGEAAKVSSSVRAKLRDLTVDYARGGGCLVSESSSSDEETESEEEGEDMEHAWGELDKDAETTEESTTRLAVCNMDWDRVRSDDLMVLLSSFLPAGGAILRITIYPSDFGLQCMKEEEMMGPKELAEQKNVNDDESGGEDHFDVERLRVYELRRLRYYYAVVECDSVSTASHIYEQCDGIEYESSSAKLDLRFIPDDVKFDNSPRDECTQLPEQNKYQPQFFEASALCKSKFELSWDTTDPRRVQLSQRVWATKDKAVDDDELRAVLASSSGSEAESEGEESSKAKYRALLQDLNEDKGETKELEVTWGVGLQAQTDKKAEEKRRAAAGLGEKTPFEQMMERKRQRRKEKKLQREKKQQEKQVAGSDEEKEEEAFSDDELPEELNELKDEILATEFDTKHTKKRNKKKGLKNKEEIDVDSKEKAELELLLMDEAEDESRHFNFDTRATKSKKKKEQHLQQQDDFQVNVGDPRFAALYTSHLYNVDPADKHYRTTPGTKAFVNEKLRRRQLQDGDHKAVKPKPTGEQGPRDAELSMLVRSVKRKTEQSMQKQGAGKRKK